MMIEETGTIVDVQGAVAWVETQRRSTCERCSVNKGCGAATVAKVLGRRRSVVRALHNVDAAVGDQVVLGLQDSALVRGSAAVYGVPLLAMFVGALLGESVNDSLQLLSADLAAAVSGLAGLLAGLAWVRRFGRRIQDDVRYQPIVLRRLASRDNHGDARMLF